MGAISKENVYIPASRWSDKHTKQSSLSVAHKWVHPTWTVTTEQHCRHSEYALLFFVFFCLFVCLLGQMHILGRMSYKSVSCQHEIFLSLKEEKKSEVLLTELCFYSSGPVCPVLSALFISMEQNPVQRVRILTTVPLERNYMPVCHWERPVLDRKSHCKQGILKGV